MPYFYALLIVGVSLVGLPGQASSQPYMFETENDVVDFEQVVDTPCRGVGTFSKDCVPMSISDTDDDECRESYEVFGNGTWITHRDNCDHPQSGR